MALSSYICTCIPLILSSTRSTLKTFPCPHELLHSLMDGFDATQTLIIHLLWYGLRLEIGKRVAWDSWVGLENGPLDGEDTPPLKPGLEGGAALGSSVCVCVCESVRVQVKMCECVHVGMGVYMRGATSSLVSPSPWTISTSSSSLAPWTWGAIVGISQDRTLATIGNTHQLKLSWLTNGPIHL